MRGTGVPHPCQHLVSLLHFSAPVGIHANCTQVFLYISLVASEAERQGRFENDRFPWLRQESVKTNP